MNGVIVRFTFVTWVSSGFLVLVSSVAGWEGVMVASSITFLAPIILSFLYVLVRWIITGESD